MRVSRLVMLLLSVAAFVACVDDGPLEEQQALLVLNLAQPVCQDAVEGFAAVWERAEKEHNYKKHPTEWERVMEDNLKLEEEIRRHESWERNEQIRRWEEEGRAIPDELRYHDYYSPAENRPSRIEIVKEIGRIRRQTREQLQPDLVRLDELLFLAESRLNLVLEESAVTTALQTATTVARKTCFLMVADHWSAKEYVRVTSRGLRTLEKHLSHARSLLALSRERRDEIRRGLAGPLDEIEKKVLHEVAERERLQAESKEKQRQAYLARKKAWEETTTEGSSPSSNRQLWWRKHRLERFQEIKKQEAERETWLRGMQQRVREGSDRRRLEAEVGSEESQRRVRQWFSGVRALSIPILGVIETFQEARLSNDGPTILKACDALRAEGELGMPAPPPSRLAEKLLRDAALSLHEAQVSCEKGQFSWVDQHLRSLQTVFQTIEENNPLR